MDEKYLKNYLNEHFVYETNALCYAKARLVEINESEGRKQDEINMALESFLFHSRNLIEFFYYDRDAKNYSRAFHFIGRGKWLEERPQKTKLIEEVKDRANKEIVHLTYDRILGTPPEKKWDWPDAFSDLLKVIKTFLDLLPEEYCGNGINNLKEMLTS